MCCMELRRRVRLSGSADSAVARGDGGDGASGLHCRHCSTISLRRRGGHGERLAVAAVQQAEAAAAPPPQACPIKQHQRTPGGDREARTRAAPSECPAPWLTYLYASPRASSDAKNSRLPLARVISMLWAGQWRRGMQRS